SAARPPQRGDLPQQPHRQRLRRGAQVKPRREGRLLFGDEVAATRERAAQPAARGELEPAPHRPARHGVAIIKRDVDVDAGPFQAAAWVAGVAVNDGAGGNEPVGRRPQARHVILERQRRDAVDALPHLGVGHVVKHQPQRQQPVGAAVARQRHDRRRRRARATAHCGAAAAAAAAAAGGGRCGGEQLPQHGGREREHLPAGGQAGAVVKREGGAGAGLQQRKEVLVRRGGARGPRMRQISGCGARGRHGACWVRSR
ncbi:MAG: hypothetical protein J3K34DRAFT_482376, partial [Monoraphidium minutum]